MASDNVQRWLRRRARRDAAGNVAVVFLALAAGAVVLTVTFFFTYALVWFAFRFAVSSVSEILLNRPVRPSHAMILWICSGILGLLFIGNARTSREDLGTRPRQNYTASPSQLGFLGPLGVLLAYPGASSRLIADLLFTGPRCVVAAWRASQKAARLLRLDVESCACVLAVLAERDGHLSREELAEQSGARNAGRAFEQLRDIEGVVFLDLGLPGLSLTADLRQELRALGPGAHRPARSGDSFSQEPTLCELLGVAPDASPEEIEVAYDAWIRQTPADRGGRRSSGPEARLEEQARAVRAAYEAFLASRRAADAAEPEETTTPEAAQETENVEGLWRQYQRPRGE